jgi:hypothetical protein
MSYIDLKLNIPNNKLRANQSDDIYNYSANQIQFYNNINEEIKSNKIYKSQLIQIKWNTFFYKKYKAENDVLYFIIKLCVVIIIISLIHKHLPFFDDNAYSIVIGIIMSFGFIYIFYGIWNIIYKNNMNFDENEYLYYNSMLNNLDTSNNLNCLSSTAPDICFNDIDDIVYSSLDPTASDLTIDGLSNYISTVNS